MSTRRILLADADAFYVAVARLVDPEGAGKAPLLIVGGSADHRGVVTSASYEARKYGVQSAMPMARALRLCPDAMVVPVPMAVCVQKGREIRQTLQQFTPVVEQASSDEFYLDLTGTEKLYHNETLQQTAQRMREAVRKATQLTVSIGGGTSRVVAKLAAGLAKPRSSAKETSNAQRPTPNSESTGIYIVPPGGELGFMRRFQLADIHGIGPKFQQRLAGLGLRSVDDALRHDVALLVQWLGEREGHWLSDRIRGIDSAYVEGNARAKSISRDETFSRDLEGDAALDDRLRALVDRAAGDMRGDGLLAKTVTVRIRDWDFTNRSASKTVKAPISSERAILSIARERLRHLREKRRVPARLLGVALSNFVPEENPDQLSILATEPVATADTPKDRAITEAMDKLREKFGRDAITRGRTSDD